MALEIKCKKMDKRFDGYPLFSHRASISGNPVERGKAFFEVLKWMTATYGCSLPLDYHMIVEDNDMSEFWAWKEENYGVYIYLKDEKIMQWFTLRWC